MPNEVIETYRASLQGFVAKLRAEPWSNSDWRRIEANDHLAAMKKAGDLLKIHEIQGALVELDNYGGDVDQRSPALHAAAQAPVRRRGISGRADPSIPASTSRSSPSRRWSWIRGKARAGDVEIAIAPSGSPRRGRPDPPLRGGVRLVGPRPRPGLPGLPARAIPAAATGTAPANCVGPAGGGGRPGAARPSGRHHAPPGADAGTGTGTGTRPSDPRTDPVARPAARGGGGTRLDPRRPTRHPSSTPSGTAPISSGPGTSTA